MPSTTFTNVHFKLRTVEAANRHLEICIEIEVAATLALNQFQTKFTHAMINRDPLLRAEENRLLAAKTKAWNDRFAAWRAANPPTIEDVLWIVAKSGFTIEVVSILPLMCSTSRKCNNLRREMREARNKRGFTQLHYYCEHGMTSSVVRMLAMRSIDVEARKKGGYEGGNTCLHTAAWYGHLDICRLLIDKGAQLEMRRF